MGSTCGVLRKSTASLPVRTTVSVRRDDGGSAAASPVLGIRRRSRSRATNKHVSSHSNGLSGFHRTGSLAIPGRNATYLIRPCNVHLLCPLSRRRKDQAEHHNAQQPLSQARHVACYGVRRVACGRGCDSARALGCPDEPGDQASGEAQPGRNEDGAGRHPWPQENEAGGDRGAAYNDAEDGEEPDEIYGGCGGWKMSVII
jgi:hypothetical protein